MIRGQKELAISTETTRLRAIETYAVTWGPVRSTLSAVVVSQAGLAAMKLAK
jgi:hypothetical protein